MKSSMKPDSDRENKNDSNNFLNDSGEMPLLSPQNEESKRLAKRPHAPGVERKDNNPDDHGKTRGGNQSVNQG